MEKFVFHLKENIKVFSCGSKLCEMEVKFQETDDLDTQNVITLKIIVSNLQYFIYRKRHRHTKRQRQRQRRRVVRDRESTQPEIGSCQSRYVPAATRPRVTSSQLSRKHTVFRGSRQIGPLTDLAANCAPHV